MLDAEKAHHLIMSMLKIGRRIPGVKFLLRKLFCIEHPSLEREVFGMKFRNPVGLAAGFDKNAEVYDMISALGFGFTEVGTITPKPQPGNPKPRLFRLEQDQALINRMGFNNKGMNSALNNLRRKKGNSIVGANLGKNTLTPNAKAPADYLKLFRTLYDYADYFVINVSCPNIACLGDLQEKESLKRIVEPIIEFRKGQGLYRPILLKISPDLSYAEIDETIKVLKECKLDGIITVNTTTSRNGLSLSKAELKKIGNGGLSGRPLTARAIEVVRYVHEQTQGNFPIIGTGGIMTEEDALEMLKAGASLIQLYTGFIYNGPGFARRICKRIIDEEKKNPS